MRRFAAICSLLAVGGAGAGAQASAQGTPPSLAAKLVTCQTGTTAADRFAVFSGSMPAMRGARTLTMRFELLERQPGGQGFARVVLPHWGTWEKTSRQGVPGFIFTKRVEQLAAPAAFRARLTFRWLDGQGATLRTARRTSPICHQPDPRPDLHVAAVRFPAGGRPAVVVRNRGRSTAGPFTVRMSRAGIAATRQVVALAAGDRQTLSFNLGRCTAGEPVTVSLDPADRIDEADEADNVVTVACPSR
jgi:hypothetical protein